MRRSTTPHWSSKAAAVTVACALAASCGVGGSGGEGDTLTMTVWTSDEAQLDLLRQIADDFAESHGTGVEIETIPEEDYVSKLSVRLSGGDAPDLGWLGAPDAVGMADKGTLVDVSSELREDEEYDFGDLVPTALTNWEQGDALYGVPFSTSPFFTIYNKDLFDEADAEDPGELAEQGEWTWEELAATGERMSGELPEGSYVFQSNEGGMYGPMVWTTLVPLLRAYGTDVWDPESRQCLLDSEEAVSGLEVYHRMAFEDGTAVPPGEEADFYAGRSAVTLTQLSRLDQLKDAGFDWGVTTLPAGDGGQPFFTGDAGTAVFDKAPNKELAVEFLKHLSSPENVRELAAFYPPARESVLSEAEEIYADGILPEDAIEPVLVQGISEGRPQEYPSEWAQLKQTVEPRFDELWKSGAAADTVVDRVCTDAQPLLEP